MHGLEMSRDHGIHVWDHMIYGLGVYGSILKGDRDAASRFLDRMKSTLMMERKQGFCHYHHVAGWYNAVFGNTADALSHAELAVKLASEISGSGVYFREILCRFGLADILCDREDYEGTGRQLAAGRKLTARTGSTIMEFTQRLLEARIAFGTGNDAQGLRRLQAALRLGRRHDFAATLWWWRSSAHGRALLKSA